jgi:hypothetical protein
MKTPLRLLPSLLPSLLASAGLALLAACGGGGGGSADTTAGPSVPLSGTVAVGAPLVGATVTVKGANGEIATATTNADGEYTTNIAALTTPLMVQARGTSAGNPIELFSLATSASATLNVTPLTHAVTTQVFGGHPAISFDVAANIAQVDPATLNLAKTRITEALAPVLTQLGQSDTQVDLFTTRFPANNTGLDKLLDLVAFDNLPHELGTIRIQDKSNGASVSLAANASNVAPLPAINESVFELDTAGIKQVVIDMNAAIRRGQNATAIEPFLHSEFVMEGLTAADFLSDMETVEYLSNATFTEFVQSGCSSDGVCGGMLGLKLPNGETDSMFITFKKEGIAWKLYGDRKPFLYDLKPVVFTQWMGNNKTLMSGFNFYVPNDSRINGQTVTQVEMFLVTDGTDTLPAQANYVLNAPASGAQASAASASNCYGVDYLILENERGLCGNFGEVSDDNIRQFNAAADEGKLRVFIKAYSGTTLLTPQPHEVMQRTRFLLSNEAATVAATSGVAVDTAGFGKQSIAFSVPRQFNRYSVSAGFYSGDFFADVRWQDAEAHGLNGLVTASKAQTQWCADQANKASCQQSFPASAQVSFLNLYIHQPQFGLWYEYSADR